MSVWVLLQIAVNFVLFLGVWALWSKFRRPPKDDPRLSRGLQLLQSKISVLEDLSDKTDQQVSHIVALLDKKCRELQNKVHGANVEIRRVELSIEKSLEVSKIFEDRIPHQEIIERQRTKSYVRAAQMAHEGMSVDEIAKKVNLPIGEIELIAKVNKDRLMFSREDLPAWAKNARTEDGPIGHVPFNLTGHEVEEDEANFVPQADEAAIFKPLIQQPKTLETVGEEFRKACREMEEQQKQMEVESPAEKVMQQLGESAANRLRQISQGAMEKISGIRSEIKKELKFELKEAVAGVEVVGPNSAGGKRVSQRRIVEPTSIKKIEFPKIDLP